MLGLAAVTALSLMAFVGAGTASATTLSTDAAGTFYYSVGTEILLSLKAGTSATFDMTAGGEIATCAETTIKGAVGTATGTWVRGNISVWIAGGCKQTSDITTLGSLEVMKTGEDKAEVVGRGSTVTIQLFGLTCAYGTGEGTKLGTITGGEASELLINAVIQKLEGPIFCPNTGRWTATYVVTTPHALHFVE